MSKVNFKITEFPGTQKQFNDRVRFARGKSVRVRAAIAAELGKGNVSTLNRYIRKLDGKRRTTFGRQGRRDKGATRRLNETWVRFAVATFVNRPPASFRRTHLETVARCVKRGIKAPSASWTRRSINRWFMRLFHGVRVKKLGEFKREGKQA